jgi:DNA replication protein DnaC
MSLQLEATLTETATRNLSVAQILSVERRFRLSRLYAQPSGDSFRFHHHKSRQHLKHRILRLLDLDFIAKGTHVCISGNPGVGKTFLAEPSA